MLKSPRIKLLLLVEAVVIILAVGQGALPLEMRADEAEHRTTSYLSAPGTEVQDNLSEGLLPKSYLIVEYPAGKIPVTGPKGIKA